MRSIALTLTATAIALGMSGLAASAQTQSIGANVMHAQTQNFTPITKQVACKTGWHDPSGCGPGWVWSAQFHRCVRCSK